LIKNKLFTNLQKKKKLKIIREPKISNINSLTLLLLYDLLIFIVGIELIRKKQIKQSINTKKREKMSK
jgi:hypothetical protein